MPGSIIKSIHGSSLILAELVNNFEHHSHCITALKNSSFHPKIALLIDQIQSSKKRALPTHIKPNIDIRLAQVAAIRFLHVASFLDNTYGKDRYTYHNLCFYQEVPFKVHHGTSNQVDDSALIYVDRLDNHHIGFIMGIIRLKETKEIKFIMNEADIFGCDSLSLDRTQYINDLLIHAVMPTPRRTVSINYDSVREKVAYRRDENSTSRYVFHLFPNLLEST